MHARSFLSRFSESFDDKSLPILRLSAELGDYDPSRHSPGYVSEFRFVAAQTEEMEEEIEALHRRLKGLRPADAERTYLEKVKWLDLYGVDLHPVIVSVVSA